MIREAGYEIRVWTSEKGSKRHDGGEVEKMPFWAVRETAVALDAFPADGFVKQTSEDGGTYSGFPGLRVYNNALAAIEEAGLDHGREPADEGPTHPVYALLEDNDKAPDMELHLIPKTGKEVQIVVARTASANGLRNTVRRRYRQRGRRTAGLVVDLATGGLSGVTSPIRSTEEHNTAAVFIHRKRDVSGEPMTTHYEPVASPDSTTIFEYHDLTPPTLTDVYAARKTLRQYLPRTPLVRSESLSAEFDAEVYLKREDTLPTGAFKVRGGLTLASTLDEEFRESGLIAASTGNHGASVAYAGREFGVPVVIGVPENANPDKVATMEALGAEVAFHGTDFDEAREWVEQRAAEEGFRYVHSANEPALVAGVATAGLEIVEELPEVDVVFSPVGGGSSASGYCLTVGQLTDASVIGVQSEAADGVYRAWNEGHLEPAENMNTFAEGIATRVPFALTMEILRERLDEMMVVTDEALRNGIYRLFVDDHVLMEGACATAIAAMEQLREAVAGKTVVFPVSGRNLAAGRLMEILSEFGES